MHVHRSAALGAALLVIACGSSSSGANAIPMQLGVSPARIPADGTTVATVTPPPDAVPPILFMTTFGTLEAPDGKTGRFVRLAENGPVTLRSPCNAAGGEVCVGRPRISAVDARSATGSCSVELYCPDGVACAMPPADMGGGWGGGGSGSGSSCTAQLWSECSGSDSGYHLLGVKGTSALNDEEVKSSSTSTVSLYSRSARSEIEVQGDVRYVVQMSDGAELKVGTYAITGASEPGLAVEIGGGSCVADEGSTFAIDRATSSNGAFTDFRVRFQAKCIGGGQICGCMHYVP